MSIRIEAAEGCDFAFPFFPHRHLVRVELTTAEIRRAVRAALAEDLGRGDVTTLATVPASSTSVALMRAREPLTVAGLAFAEEAFRQTTRKIGRNGLVRRMKDGDRAKAGDILLKISGPSRAILSAERVALNFVQRLSGVATATAQFADAIKSSHAKILDTRKTTPG